ncbi:MAG: SxtJ family membrane protein [Gammaproteobacteria bacterium]|nr:SxtJ family membrane protein [Gammaproteobacteria bacterium]
MHEIAELDKPGLRKFGLITGAIVVGLFGLLLPWLLDHHWPVWPWVVAAALWVPALVFPAVLKPVYRGWMKFGAVLGFINTRLILGLFFLCDSGPHRRDHAPVWSRSDAAYLWHTGQLPCAE